MPEMLKTSLCCAANTVRASWSLSFNRPMIPCICAVHSVKSCSILFVSRSISLRRSLSIPEASSVVYVPQRCSLKHLSCIGRRGGNHPSAAAGGALVCPVRRRRGRTDGRAFHRSDAGQQKTVSADIRGQLTLFGKADRVFSRIK